ncbi:hypothetical protein Gasu2_51890 [Galdieria sulphuraria]|uniref:Uncharacterized protein n=1 Tax=Galdieria sulphuraria TaxID=130081 RepID=M2WSV2_GALSU|nr:uncharacterized protein Gasu_54090 [Galdieria sulphuraria]EME26955.1 hypothetical protein Gasu_54090 [Galdieria sulphuraria]GJD11032.1 hypothetical protein Gasu2_51890 [Galdieria sulphuraria]|eukprot:XP_005703475.1 hypothetical protein Gasu_54090 [Galdieria sulphuraria]
MFTQFAKDLFRYSDKMEKSSVSDISSPRSKEAQQKLLELTKHGLLKVGEKVQFYYKAKEFAAQVTSEGCLLYQGENGESELFLSPSAFVNTLAKRQGPSSRGKSKPKLNLNGWEFCFVAGVSLSQLKQQLESILQAEGTAGSSSWKTNIKSQGKQESETGDTESLLKEQQSSDPEDSSTPLKKKPRIEKNEDSWVADAQRLEKSQEHSADISQVEEVVEERQEEEEKENEQGKQEEDSQPSESENDDGKNLKKRTTRLSSGSIKHISYTKGTKQISNDEASSVDPDKTDDDKELDTIEGTSTRGRRRRLSATTRNSSRLASQITKSSKGKQEASSDEEERSIPRVSGRYLRRDKARESSPKVMSTQEDDQQSHSDDNGEVKQENDELNSQVTGEDDADDLEGPSAYTLLEQIKEAERIELHCGWSKEDRESLLDALRDTKQLDPTVLSQHMMGSKSSEEITEYLKVLKDRLVEATKDTGSEPNVSLYTMLLSLELLHTGVVANDGVISKKLEHTCKTSIHMDSQDKVLPTSKRTISDTDRILKKMRKEVEELRNKVEMEMAARRDLELEKQLLEVQLQEAKRATEREARKRAAIEDENEEMKVRELETRRRLDRLKLKLTAIKGEVNTTDGKDNMNCSVTSPSAMHSMDNTKVVSGETAMTEEKDSIHEEPCEIVSPSNLKEHSKEEMEKLQEEVDRLRSKVASLETEVSDFQQDAENERRRNYHLMEAKKYLEISLNEVLHASKSSSPDEMEVTSNEQSVTELEAKSNFLPKDMNERVFPSLYRFTSSIVARRRKSRAFRSMLV